MTWSRSHLWEVAGGLFLLVIVGFGAVELTRATVERGRGEKAGRVRDGYDAGKAGIPVEAGPWHGNDTWRHRDWLEGWRKGCAERNAEKDQHKEQSDATDQQ
jgi:ribosome modulation factor